jgi:hypothetical protein
VPTTFPAPCVLAGSLELTYGRVYSSVEGGEQVLGVFGVEVEALEVPARREGRFRVVLSWPVRAEGFLGPASLPLENTKRIAVKEPYLWLDPGAKLFAWQTGAGATVARPLEYDRLDRVFKVERPCDELALAGSAPRRELFANYMDGPVELFASVGGRRLAKLDFDTVSLPVEVLERKGDWSRVRGQPSSYTLNVAPYLPFDFEGWTKATIDDDMGFMVGDRRDEPPTHRVASAFPLRSEPRSQGNIVATTVAGTPITVVNRELNGFVVVGIDGVLAANGEFWAEKSAIKRSTEPW